MQADGLEVEQGDTLERADRRIDVARQAEVDDERAGSGGHVVDADAQPGRAGDDDLGSLQRRAQVVGRLEPLPLGEELRAAGGGVDGDATRTALAQGRDGRGRVAPRADDEHLGRAPVGEAAADEVDREAGERAARSARIALGACGACGADGFLHDVVEAARARSGLACTARGATHLPGNLFFSDRDRVEAGADREQVVHGSGVVEHLGGRREVARGLAPELGERALEALPGERVGRDGRGVDVKVQLDAITRRHGDRAAQLGSTAGDGVGQLARVDGEPFEDLERGVPMIGGYAEQHETSV